jgi:hypothetical protein
MANERARGGELASHRSLRAVHGGMTVVRDRLQRTLAPSEIRERVATQVSTTPGRLNAYLVVLILLGLLSGVAAVVGAAQRGSAVDAVSTGSGPGAIRAQALYRSLSDADATAAAAFLSSGAEPPQLRQRYLDDIASASSALARTAVSSDAEQAPVERIANALPVYSGLVETARTQNRLGLPVGAAYLREASTLMRGTLLPAAHDLYQIETAKLADDRSRAASFPWLALLLILLTLAGLVVTQVYLVRRTQRLLNVGLVVATAAGAALLLWVSLAWVGVHANLNAADRDGSAQVQAVAGVRIAALQARADEALTLVARGSGSQFEDDFKARLTDIVGQLDRATNNATDDGVRQRLSSARQQLTQWQAAHVTLRALDDSGQYPQAVAAAIGPQSTLFASIDNTLQQVITTTGATFADRADRASNTLDGAVVAWTLLTLILIAGLVAGVEQRIAEYR